MAIKLPPKPTAPASQPTTTDPVRPVTKSAPVASSRVSQFSDTFKRRRSGIWAVGIPVIVVAGVYIGAQYKESVQTQERLSALQREKEKDLASGANSSRSTGTTTVASGQSDKALGSTSQKEDAGKIGEYGSHDKSGSRGMSYSQRQISFLEDRRGVLMKQKFDLERKIERVREKKKREEEMEGRRAVAVEGDR